MRCYTCKQEGSTFVSHVYSLHKPGGGWLKKTFLICNPNCIRKCKYCDKTGKPNTISMHMKDTHPLDFMSDKHTTAFKHKCSYCPQLFTYSTHRDSHVKFNHTAPSFACNTCDFVTRSKYALSGHNLTHADIKLVKAENGEYECPNCCATHTKHLLAKCLGL